MNKFHLLPKGIDSVLRLPPLAWSFFMTEREFKAIEEGAKIIPLSRGFFAIVDPENFASLSAMRWHATTPSPGRPQIYAVRNRKKGDGQRSLKMHRHVLVTDAAAVDHKNGDTLDNRLANLRPASFAQNSWNSNTAKHSPTRGVTFFKGKFVARITICGYKRYLGRFSECSDAAAAYAKAAIELHGEFSTNNSRRFPAKR